MEVQGDGGAAVISSAQDPASLQRPDPALVEIEKDSVHFEKVGHIPEESLSEKPHSSNNLVTSAIPTTTDSPASDSNTNNLLDSDTSNIENGCAVSDPTHDAAQSLVSVASSVGAVGADVNATAEDASSMALAAAEAAAAAAAAEEVQRQQDQDAGPSALVCRLCGKSQEEDPRTFIRFTAMEGQSGTMGEDIALHVFCGKTASILPTVNNPTFEILSKAGLKNKHGIGPDVNGALARTRCSTPAGGPKEKVFYLVKEFEANLTMIRNATSAVYIPPAQEHHYAELQHYPHHESSQKNHSAYHDAKQAPHRANITHAKHSYSSSGRQSWGPGAEVTVTMDGKIRCGCGGVHLPTGSPKGDSSWRSHVMTKRHQKWMEENGLLGSV